MTGLVRLTRGSLRSSDLRAICFIGPLLSGLSFARAISKLAPVEQWDQHHQHTGRCDDL